MKILINQVDAIYCKIAASPDLLMEISEYFTFDVPNASFMKKKGGYTHWDGKIRLLKRRNHLYVGLIPELLKFLEKKGVEVAITLSPFYRTHHYTDNQIQEWIETELKLPENIKLRDYQKKILEEGIKEKRAVFLSATSSGKSLCIYGLTKFWFDNIKNCRVLIVVPSINLVTQLTANFQEYGWEYPELVSQYYHESHVKNLKQPIIISTWQSAYKWEQEILDSFDVVIFDEVHVAKAKEISHFLEKLKNCHVRYGFTGTLDDEQAHHFIIEGLFGPRQNIIDVKNLIEQGHATELKLFPIALKHNRAKSKLGKFGFGEFYDEIDFIVDYETRNKFLLALAASLKGNSMILFGRIRHGEVLYEMAKKLFPDKKVHLIYGNTKAEIREKVRKLTNKDWEGNSLIIASIQVFSVGVDIPTLKNLILAHPTKSKIRLFQSIGRILRKHKVKETCNFYDIGDNFQVYKQYTWGHFLKRLHYYMTSGIQFEVKEITL